jgi:hypothetical protein
MKKHVCVCQQFAFFVSMVASMICFSSRLVAAETIVDNLRGFTLKLPDGFAPAPQFVGVRPNIIHAFAVGDPNDASQIKLFIEKMNGTIGRERLKPEQLPPGFRGRLFTMRWHGFDIDAFEVPEQVGDIGFISYNVQVPLRLSPTTSLLRPTVSSFLHSWA